MKQTLRLRGKLCPKTKPSINLLYTIFITFTIVLVSCVCTRAQVSASSPEAGPAAGAVRQPIVTQHLKGVVVSAADGKSLEGATVKLKNTNLATLTNENGEFSLPNRREGVLEISFLGYQTQEYTLSNNSQTLTISLEPDEGLLEEVMVSTGYQEIPKERATGSFTKPDKEMYEARLATDIISRLEGITSGVLFNRATSITNEGKVDISIRGRSTIYANDQPLIVVDNFPYDGNIDNINPNDVESITILKDAAAASIWGVRAGNGVIVIKTKKAKLNQSPKISAMANVTIGEKPNLYYDPNFLPSEQYIGIQQFLFRKGKFDGDLRNTTTYPSIPSAVEIMAAKRNGSISKQDSILQMASLENVDIRDGLFKYFYVNPINQQYAFDISAGSGNSSYYFSAGYDKIQTNQRSIHNDRITLNLSNVYSPIKNLEITTQFNYVLGRANRGNPLSLSNATSVAGVYYPYTAFKDEDGTLLSVNKGYRKAFIEGAAQKGFLNWGYNPLSELYASESITKTTQARIQAGMRYTISKGLDIEAKYQFQHYNTSLSDLQGLQLYSTRDQINKYSILSEGKVIGYNMPIGDILYLSDSFIKNNNVRGQLSYGRNGTHSVHALVGAEITEYRNKLHSNQLYGYNPANETFATVDQLSYFTLNPSGIGTIANGDNSASGTDRYRSFFATASYTYKYKYTMSASARQDGSNYFGVATNQKMVPLWSAGIKWYLNKEDFFSLPYFSTFRFRATYGYNGNLNKSVTGVTTFYYQTNATWTNLPYATISNLGNPELRWERNGILNFGIDFSLKDKRIAGSIEYFLKHGVDLIGDQLLAPSVGYVSPATATNALRGNFANTRGRGFDIQLSSKNIEGPVSWTTVLNLSYATDKVTRYDQKNTNFGSFVGNGGSILPYVGKPVYSLYSYKWAGLDPNTGDPQGYVGGRVSKDYSKLTRPASLEDIVYEGRSRPAYFGGIVNRFSYNRFSFMFNIGYKFGYAFRPSTISYSRLFATGGGHKDYMKRWVAPGDELNTDVPSMAYPAPLNRDRFYSLSETNVENGSHIRLRDIYLGYDILPKSKSKSSFQKFQVFAYLNNLGILWKANDKGLDPDFPWGGIPNSRTISLGIKTEF